jgi:hypothetical protein
MTLNTLFEQGRASSHFDFSITEYRLNAMIVDGAHRRLLQPLQIMNIPPDFSPISNEELDAVNLSNMFLHKHVQFCIIPDTSSQVHTLYFLQLYFLHCIQTF